MRAADEGREPVRPEVTVVMASQRDLAALHACIASLRGLGAELIVARACQPQELEELSRAYADVRFVPCGAAATSAQLRAAGMSAATGDVVALAEDDCAVTRDWLDHMLSSYRRSRTE